MNMFYEITTPQTLLKYKVRALSYGDELDLKSLITSSESGITKHFNKILYSSIQESPESITSYEDFIKSTTLADRIALVAGLYHVTYGDEYVSETICPECGYKNSSKISLAKFSKINFYNGEPLSFLSMRKEIDLPSGAKIILEPPTLEKEIKLTDLTEGMEINPSILALLLYMEKIQLNDDIVQTIDKNLIEIITNIKNLSSVKVREIKKLIEDTFDKNVFKTEFKIKCKNKSCNNVYKGEIDFVEEFFRNVIQA